MKTRTWNEIKDEVYGKVGTSRRDELERDFESFKIDTLNKSTRKKKDITQQESADLIAKGTTFEDEWENSLTIEEAKEQSLIKMRKWWGG